MVMFIPIAVGLAAGAAGAIAVAVRRQRRRNRRNREKQQESAHPGQEQAHRPSNGNTSVTEQRRRQQEPSRQRQPHDHTSQQSASQRKPVVERRRQSKTQPRKVTPYDRQALVKALDKAIAQASSDTLDSALATSPFDRMSPHEQKQRVSAIADNMRSNLHGLELPDYNNDILAAAYLLNYHPSHIGLAHAMVNRMVNSRGVGKLIVGDSGRLHVVDLAAGTLAMQFGIAIAVADTLTRGERIEEVVVDSVDISPAMLKVGRIAWDKFVLNVQSDVKLTALAESCQLIETHRYVLPGAVPQRDGECWLSCLHGIYRQNSNDLKQSLHTLHDGHRPIAGLMSCWGKDLGDQNIAIARSISPFMGENWQTEPACFLEKGAEYGIPFLFQNREEDASQTVDIGRRTGILPPTWNIFWRPADTAILTYHREFYGHGN